MGHFSELRRSLQEFSAQERRNVMIYILGIMAYKFGLEAFNGSVVALATNRYDYESIHSNTPSRTFERVGLITGLNQAFQCIGSILIAPLVKRYPTKNVLAVAVTIFGFCTALLIILDAATGGSFMPAEYRGVGKHPKNKWDYYGSYNTDAMIPIYCISGVAYGMVELIRRVIPRDIVGGSVQKLRQVDSIVHIFYEITGTAGAFTTGLVIIPQLGNNMAFIITPLCFSLSALAWLFLSDVGFTRTATTTTAPKPRRTPTRYWKSALSALLLFFESILVGARLLFSSRRFIWLIPGYALALHAHRYLENGIAPQIARRYLGDASWSQIIVGGSNAGELLGALAVLLLSTGGTIPTPMPWLRLDALLLMVVWFLPYWRPEAGHVGQAWLVAGTFIPVSFGWAAGDVSLAAYIQAAVGRLESRDREVSALGAVMAFLYSFYIVTYAIVGTLLGRYLDGVYNATGGSAGGGSIDGGLVYTAGVQFTVIAGLVMASTFVPKGALAFNPKMLEGDGLEGTGRRSEESESVEPFPGGSKQKQSLGSYEEESIASIQLPKRTREMVC